MLKKGDEKDLRWWGLSKKCSQPKELPQPEGEQFEQQDKVILDYKLCWSWNSNTLANWCGELTRLKRPWCWERLKVHEEGDDRGWDGCMALPTGWTWVWLSSGSWWWTWKPGVLQSMGSQRVRHDWVTQQQQWTCKEKGPENVSNDYLWKLESQLPSSYLYLSMASPTQWT